MLRDAVNSLQFSLRRNILGKLKLRPGLPKAVASGLEERFYREILETAFPDGGEWVGAVIDVGCRNWTYAGALARFFPEASLLGIELDGSRRYWNLHRRRDQAEAFAASLRRGGRSARAIEADFLALTPAQAGCAPDLELVTTFFFPFVSADPCLGWGLPKRYSFFLPLLRHARALLACSAPTSSIVSCHQGEWEAEIAEAAYREAGLRVATAVVSSEAYQHQWPCAFDTHILTAAKR